MPGHTESAERDRRAAESAGRDLRAAVHLSAQLPYNRELLGARFVPSKERAEPAHASGCWLVVREQTLVLPGDAGACALPRGERSVIPFATGPALWIGDWDGEPCWACAVAKEVELPEGWRQEPLVPMLGARLPEELLTLGGIALQQLWWEGTSAFCPRCGAGTERVDREWGKRCRVCAYEHFPHLHPAVIVLVRDGDRVLLARRSTWKPGLYALVAGFVDNGESLEGCVEREVLEEVGVRVEDVRYRGSQNWPFPSQIMCGFTAEYAGGTIQVDRRELEDARWFRRGEPEHLPRPLSIARHLIDRFGFGAEELRDAGDLTRAPRDGGARS